MSSRTAKRKAAIQAQREEITALILPEMYRLSQELHGGQYAPNQAEFVLFAEGNMPDRTKLSMAFGQWRNAAGACGLPLAPPTYYYDKRKERETSALWTSQI